MHRRPNPIGRKGGLVRPRRTFHRKIPAISPTPMKAPRPARIVRTHRPAIGESCGKRATARPRVSRRSTGSKAVPTDWPVDELIHNESECQEHQPALENPL